MPAFLVWLLIGGGALGAAYFMGRRSASSFSLEDCIDKYTRMGYTTKKAMELCQKDFEAYSKSHDYIGKTLTYAIPAVVLLGGAYWLYNRYQKKAIMVLPKKIIVGSEEKQYGYYSPHPIKK